MSSHMESLTYSEQLAQECLCSLKAFYKDKGGGNALVTTTFIKNFISLLLRDAMKSVHDKEMPLDKLYASLHDFLSLREHIQECIVSAFTESVYTVMGLNVKYICLIKDTASPYTTDSSMYTEH